MLNKTKMIKTKNVIFNYSKFYDFIELNLAHILIFSIKSIVEMLNLSKMSLIFSEINETEKFEKKNRRYRKFDQTKRNFINQRHYFEVDRKKKFERNTNINVNFRNYIKSHTKTDHNSKKKILILCQIQKHQI